MSKGTPRFAPIRQARTSWAPGLALLALVLGSYFIGTALWS